VEFRGLMGGFYRISEWIMRLSVTNVLWIVTAFPVFFFVLNMFVAQDEAQVQASLFAIAVLAPFTLFPSTSAMFALARKWITGDGDVSLLKTYFRAYKENYVQSMIGGIIFMVMLGILFFNFRFYSTQTGYAGMLSYLFIALSVLLLLAVFNFFCIVVHLHMKTLQVFKNALLITIGQPIRSFLIGISNVVILWISFTQFTFLIPFFMGSLMAIVTFWHFHNGFRKILNKQEELENRENETSEDASAEVEDKENPSKV
jgi:uncharacterized membrane protein YesL